MEVVACHNPTDKDPHVEKKKDLHPCHQRHTPRLLLCPQASGTRHHFHIFCTILCCCGKIMYLDRHGFILLNRSRREAKLLP